MWVKANNMVLRLYLPICIWLFFKTLDIDVFGSLIDAKYVTIMKNTVSTVTGLTAYQFLKLYTQLITMLILKIISVPVMWDLLNNYNVKLNIDIT